MSSRHGSLVWQTCSAIPQQQQPAAPAVAAAAELFRTPGRGGRPSRIVVLLRGAPGSGKSAAARKVRQAEADAGADPVRVHSIDDYFVTVRRLDNL